MIDQKAFFSLSYGLYLVSSRYGAERAGCTVNTLAQVTAEPPKLAVALNKDNRTTEIVRRSGLFTGAVLSRSAPLKLIGVFGFRSSTEIDKFSGFQTAEDENGVPYVAEQIVARLSCKVTGELDLGTHILFLGEVTHAARLSEEEPMTYAHYHQVKKGLTPPKASSYQPPRKEG